VPRCDHPDELSKFIFSIFDDKGHGLPSRKPDNPILSWIVGPLVFEIGKAEKVVEGSKVDSASFSDPLAFLLVPPNPHP